ncbi:RNA binding protein [Trichosporon asahii var. asahii CBS 2479]|uniref:RNA binding protein n=1 Tax=Trichosporon asahii var. asahii (strain ATCC 90039 / CBS 2479 / JCM 2466 / KCTC 7840 / NBRC 103889/ NCYC 2677 / UAMH 7654) TaxID=1186058 RepID=J6ES15_TRIAS|nr:RNA binding protein [Trichosporon asahii var. asahii CBS 2479]EJT45492.1 RNA binding protein [Trichosporon asahii var. asahii CBS 2479]
MSERGRSRSPKALTPSPRRNGDVAMSPRAPSAGGSASGSRVIVIDGLTKNVHPGHLREIFGFYGRVTGLDLPVFKVSGLNRGKAALEFDRPNQAEEAVRCMDGGILDGSVLKVQTPCRLLASRRPLRGAPRLLRAEARSVRGRLLRDAAEAGVVPLPRIAGGLPLLTAARLRPGEAALTVALHPPTALARATTSVVVVETDSVAVVAEGVTSVVAVAMCIDLARARARVRPHTAARLRVVARTMFAVLAAGAARPAEATRGACRRGGVGAGATRGAAAAVSARVDLTLGVSARGVIAVPV